MTTPLDARPFGPRRLIAAPPRDPRGHPRHFVATTPDGNVDLAAEMARVDRRFLRRAAHRSAVELLATQGIASGYTGHALLTEAEIREWARSITDRLVALGQAALGPIEALLLAMMKDGHRTRLVAGRAITAEAAAITEDLDQRRAMDTLLDLSPAGITYLIDGEAGDEDDF